jgi:pyridoxine 5'-phosphate synthase PdxJ
MSHTTEVNDIVFTDVEALKAAVNELASKGIRVSLQKGGTPRAYSAGQSGMGPADYVLKLEQSPYDVGFYNDKEKKGMVARTDFYARHVENILGVQPKNGDDPNRAKLGKLYQTYAIHAASRQAAKQGLQTRRVNNEDGSVRLVLTGNFN